MMSTLFHVSRPTVKFVKVLPLMLVLEMLNRCTSTTSPLEFTNTRTTYSENGKKTHMKCEHFICFPVSINPMETWMWKKLELFGTSMCFRNTFAHKYGICACVCVYCASIGKRKMILLVKCSDNMYSECFFVCVLSTASPRSSESAVFNTGSVYFVSLCSSFELFHNLKTFVNGQFHRIHFKLR